jgi:hypothetical protein
VSESDTVKLTIDLTKPPVVTSAQKARLAALAAMPDGQIDTSDAPFRLDAVWVKGVDVPPGRKATFVADR